MFRHHYNKEHGAGACCKANARSICDASKLLQAPKVIIIG